MGVFLLGILAGAVLVHWWQKRQSAVGNKVETNDGKVIVTVERK
ncbi:hypothetical protein [Streptomyces hydrogenans]